MPYFYKEPKEKSDISVKGYFEQRFTSDEIQWEASFSTTARENPETAMRALDRDKDKILRFLRQKGFSTP